MKRLNWQVVLCACLLALSAVFYFVHYLIFKDAHHIFIYMFGDIAFVFTEVLLVTVIIHRVLEARERKARLVKLNMVIGAFFSEAGDQLLRTLSEHDPVIEQLQQQFTPENESVTKRLETIRQCLTTHDHKIETSKLDMASLKAFLIGKRNFLLRLLENPSLLEHESFTDVLWAVFHLTEELHARADLDGLPETDIDHLDGDVQRVYGRLSLQWLEYMKHLGESYPYLFSLAMRINPFDRSASAIVEK
jgi:hypothetical protein